MGKDITLKEHCASIASKGGRSRSEAKRKAGRENIRKALHARFPSDPRWMPKK